MTNKRRVCLVLCTNYTSPSITSTDWVTVSYWNVHSWGTPLALFTDKQSFYSDYSMFGSYREKKRIKKKKRKKFKTMTIFTRLIHMLVSVFHVSWKRCVAGRFNEYRNGDHFLWSSPVPSHSLWSSLKCTYRQEGRATPAKCLLTAYSVPFRLKHHFADDMIQLCSVNSFFKFHNRTLKQTKTEYHIHHHSMEYTHPHPTLITYWDSLPSVH